MQPIVSHLDVTQIFCDVDDFCQQFERLWQQQVQLPSMLGEKRSRSRLHLSEVMTKGNCLSRLRLSHLQGLLHVGSVAALARCLSPLGQLQPLCGVDALELDAVVLLSAHPSGRNDRHQFH